MNKRESMEHSNIFLEKRLYRLFETKVNMFVYTVMFDKIILFLDP